MLDILRDALGEDDLTSDTIAQRELALDKELIQLIQNACKNDKPTRALDLTKLLHHTASFDMATKVAGFYHLIGLQEKMEMLKEDREDDDRLVGLREKRRERAQESMPVPKARQPGYGREEPQRSKAFQDFRPPPAVHRPGLERAQATPRPSKTRVAEEELQANGYLGEEDYLGERTPEGKRKRSEEPVLGGGANGKRRAVDESVSARASVAMAQPSKWLVLPLKSSHADSTFRGEPIRAQSERGERA